MLNVPEFTEHETYWSAVQAKDAHFDGTFVYAVRSTGIYCRPSCPARKARREQVQFYATWAAAEEGGFRACRRCHPKDALAPGMQAEIVRRACQLIDEAAGEPRSLGSLSAELHISPSHFHRMFKAVMGLTPRQYAAGRRMDRFKTQVKAGDNVTAALYNSGFSSSSRLYETASSHLGMTPAEYRRGGRGMDIHYTITDTYLGRMLVAGTPRGVCAVSFGANDHELEEHLRSEYPAARIHRDEGLLHPWVAELAAHLERPRQELSLPLDLQATAFQLRVWSELRKIPSGETRTYTEVARAVNQPKAFRAIANACASNPVAVVNPCHRVVRSDGNLGGYRWGLERKQALLDKERQAVVTGKG